MGIVAAVILPVSVDDRLLHAIFRPCDPDCVAALDRPRFGLQVHRFTRARIARIALAVVACDLRSAVEVIPSGRLVVNTLDRVNRREGARQHRGDEKEGQDTKRHSFSLVHCFTAFLWLHSMIHNPFSVQFARLAKNLLSSARRSSHQAAFLSLSVRCGLGSADWASAPPEVSTALSAALF